MPLMNMASPTSAIPVNAGGAQFGAGGTTVPGAAGAAAKTPRMPSAQALFGASPLASPSAPPPPVVATINALGDASGVFAPTPVVDSNGRVVGQGFVAAGAGGQPTLVSQPLQRRPRSR